MFIPKDFSGYYMVQLVSGGPWIPASLLRYVTPDPDFPDNIMDRSPVWHCKIGYNEVEPDRLVNAIHIMRGDESLDDTRVSKNYRGCRQLDAREGDTAKSEYDYQFALFDWAVKHGNVAVAPAAEPMRRVDLNQIQSIF